MANKNTIGNPNISLPWREDDYKTQENSEFKEKPEKIYAVKIGRTTGIIYDWNECKKSITGYPNAKYRSFPFEKIDEAYEYLNEGSKRKPAVTKNTAVAYVDGSYNQFTKQYGSGVVMFFDGKTIELSKSGKNEELVRMRNVGGELTAVSMAIKEAIRLGAKRIVIHHDYAGISEWANGGWNTNKNATIRYKKFIEEQNKNIKIMFQKVEAHSGDTYNDMADKLAKQSVGIK